MAIKKYSISFVVILFQFVLFGQISPQEKDSLLKVVENTKAKNKLEILDQLNDYYLLNDLDSAFLYADKLLKYSKKRTNRFYEARAYQNKATYWVYKAQNYPAIDTINLAINILDKLKLSEELANSYKILAGIYYNMQKYEQAIKISFKTLENFEKGENHKGIIASYNNIGLLNETLGYNQKALSYYKKAIQYIEKNGVIYNKSYLYGNLGIVYKNLNQLDSTFYYYRKSEIENSESQNNRGLASDYYNIGNLYAQKNKIDSAHFYYKKAIKFAEKSDQSLLKNIYDRQGKIYMRTGAVDQAIPFFKKTLVLSKNENSWYGLQLANFRLYQTYKNKKEWSKSLKHLEDFVDYTDSLDIEKNNITIANLESKYENEKNKAHIKILKIKETQNRKVKRVLIFGLILLLLTLLLLLRDFSHRKKRNLLEKKLFEAENDNLNQDVNYKNRQLTSQALLMMQKNKLLDDILKTVSGIKGIEVRSNKEITQLKRKLKHSIHSDKDWELFKHYFEEINKGFFKKLHEINPKLTPSELKLSALIKLRFSIKETASLLNISPDSVKTARHILRKKLGLQTADNIYEYLNNVF